MPSSTSSTTSDVYYYQDAGGWWHVLRRGQQATEDTRLNWSQHFPDPATTLFVRERDLRDTPVGAVYWGRRLRTESSFPYDPINPDVLDALRYGMGRPVYSSHARAQYEPNTREEFSSEEEPFMLSFTEAVATERAPRLRLRFTLQQFRVLNTALEYLEYDLAERQSPSRYDPKKAAIQFWFPLVSSKRKETPSRDEQIFRRLSEFRAALRAIRSYFPEEALQSVKQLKGITHADFRLITSLLFALQHKNEVLYYLKRYEYVNALFMRANAEQIDGIKKKLETITVDRLLRRWGPIPLPAAYRYQVHPGGETTLTGGLEPLRDVG